MDSLLEFVLLLIVGAVTAYLFILFCWWLSIAPLFPWVAFVGKPENWSWKLWLFMFLSGCTFWGWVCYGGI